MPAATRSNSTGRGVTRSAAGPCASKMLPTLGMPSAVTTLPLVRNHPMTPPLQLQAESRMGTDVVTVLESPGAVT